MHDNIIELDEKNFDSSVKKGRWIIDAWTEWCGPCKVMAPHFESVAQEFKGKVNFAKVNIDENYDIANRFNIMAVPTTLFIENGEVIHAVTGAMNKSQIAEQVNNIFS